MCCTMAVGMWGFDLDFGLYGVGQWSRCLVIEHVASQYYLDKRGELYDMCYITCGRHPLCESSVLCVCSWCQSSGA